MSIIIGGLGKNILTQGLGTLVAAPAPAPAAGGTTSGGGSMGWGYAEIEVLHEGDPYDLRPQIKRRPRVPAGAVLAKEGSLAGVDTAVLQKALERAKKQSPDFAPPEISPEKVKDGVIRDLRKRITKLQEATERLKKRQARRVVGVEDQLQALQAESEKLREVIQRLEVDLIMARVEASMLGDVPTAPIATEEEKPSHVLKYLTAAAGVYALTEIVAPKDSEHEDLRTVGHLVSLGLAAAGVVDLLK